MKQQPPSSVQNSKSASLRRENKGSNNLIKKSSSVVERHCTADDSFMEEGSISVDTKQSSVDDHEMIYMFNNTEQGLNKIDNKKKSLFMKVSMDTMRNN